MDPKIWKLSMESQNIKPTKEPPIMKTMTWNSNYENQPRNNKI